MNDIKIKEKFFNNKLIDYLLFYRLILAFVAEFVIKKMTFLGDTGLYISSNPVELFYTYKFGIFIERTLLPRFLIGSISSLLRYDILIHIFCSLIAYYGIRKFLKSIPENTKNYKIIILLCYFPSFNIWSSVAGKEALIVFSIGIFLSEIIKVIIGQKIKISFSLIIALYLITVIKTQYIPAVYLLVLFAIYKKFFSIKWKTEIILWIFVIIGSLILIYIFKDKIDSYSRQLDDWYSKNARSTREMMFLEQYDFFKKLPYLMPLSMWGPSFSEIKYSILHLFSFIESFLYYGVLLFLIKDKIVPVFINFKNYYQWFFMLVTTFWWISFAQYIQGIMNSGAAIRYRANIHLILIFLFYSVYLYTEHKQDEK